MKKLILLGMLAWIASAAYAEQAVTGLLETCTAYAVPVEEKAACEKMEKVYSQPFDLDVAVGGRHASVRMSRADLPPVYRVDIGDVSISLELHIGDPARPDLMFSALQIRESGNMTFPVPFDGINDGSFVLPAGRTLLVRTSSGKTVSLVLRRSES